jgi:Tol biopolymer transport system component
VIGRGLLALVALALLALPGCGSGEQTGSPSITTASSAPRIHTARPELAFFTTHGSAIYDLGDADDRGQHPRVLAGESVPHSVTPQLFTQVSWSPDAERLAFGGGAGQQQGTIGQVSNIYSIKADGSDLKRVTDVGDAASPLWSPDGKTIIFTRMSGGEGQPIKGSLWSIGVDGSDLTQIAEASDWETYAAGSFASDGSQLAVTRWTLGPGSGEESSEIDLMEPDGSDRAQLIAEASDPAFSPDDKRLAFVSDRDRNGQLCYGDSCSYGGELYVANADGSDPQRLTDTKSLNEARPSWFLDRSRIAYQRGRVFQNAQATSIFQVNADGTCVREILAGSGPGPWYASPAWRPSKTSRGGGPLNCKASAARPGREGGRSNRGNQVHFRDRSGSQIEPAIHISRPSSNGYG